MSGTHLLQSCSKWIPNNSTTAESRSFVCDVCNVCFSKKKALACHQRIKHGLRTETRFYVEFGKCPVCFTDFHSRVRCVIHIDDKRRPSCRLKLKSLAVRLTYQRVCELDSIDRLERQEAAKEGHTHPIAEILATKRP